MCGLSAGFFYDWYCQWRQGAAEDCQLNTGARKELPVKQSASLTLRARFLGMQNICACNEVDLSSQILYPPHIDQLTQILEIVIHQSIIHTFEAFIG